MNNFLNDYDDIIKAYQKVTTSGKTLYTEGLKHALRAVGETILDKHCGGVKDVVEKSDGEAGDEKPDAAAELEATTTKQLFKDVKEGNIQAVKKAIQDDGVGVNTKDSGEKTLLIAAVIANKLDIAKFLIGMGANVNRTSGQSTALDFAKSDDMKKLLKDNGAKNGRESTLDKEYKDAPELDVGMDTGTINTKLIDAVKTNSMLGVKSFVKQGATVNYMNPKDKGRTAMFYAYTPEMIKLLHELGWDVNAFDDNGDEPIHTLSVNKDATPEAIKTIAELGADVDSQNDNRETPRTLVKKPEIWQALKDESEFKDEFNLINAVKGNKKYIVSYMLKNGENPNVRNKKGVSAYELAKGAGFKDIIELMDGYIKR